MLGEEYNACSSALCNFLHSPVILSLLGPNTFRSILFSNTLKLCSSINVRDQVSQPYNTTGNIIQCVWLILSRKFSSSPAGRKLRIWRQACRAGGGVFTEVNWLKLRYILHIMIWFSPCSLKMLYVLSIFLYARFTPFQKIVVHAH